MMTIHEKRRCSRRENNISCGRRQIRKEMRNGVILPTENALYNVCVTRVGFLFVSIVFFYFWYFRKKVMLNE